MPLRATHNGGGNPGRADSTDGARDPAAAALAIAAIPRKCWAGHRVVSVETAPSGQGLEIPLQKTPAPTTCLTAAVILETPSLLGCGACDRRFTLYASAEGARGPTSQLKGARRKVALNREGRQSYRI